MCIPPLLAQMVCCKVRGAEIMWSETGTLVKEMQPVIRTALILVTPADFWVTFYLHFQYHTHHNSLMVFNPCPHACFSQRKPPYVSESFGKEPQKNATFCLLLGSAL